MTYREALIVVAIAIAVAISLILLVAIFPVVPVSLRRGR
jgi:hypothetical protein